MHSEPSKKPENRRKGKLIGSKPLRPVLWRDQTNRACSRRGGSSSVAMSGICRLKFVDDDAPPDVPVNRAPTRHHVYSVTSRMRFDRTDFQRPRAHRA